MIYVLHGANSDDSSQKIKSLVTKYPGYEKIYVQAQDSDLLYQSLFARDITGSKKLIIVEGFVERKSLKNIDLKNVQEDNILIIWEKKEITAAQIAKLAKVANVENFKLPSTLFYFLDSISTSPGQTLKYLKELQSEKATGLAWHIANRLFLMILLKLELKEAEIQQIAGRRLAPWQLDKIKSQAFAFPLPKLKQMFSAVLKVDTLIKTGSTQMPEATLLSLMFAKYLKA
ncbi:MAG: hypothetical protein AAB512_02860 [Patescibacteria group bacterium]